MQTANNGATLCENQICLLHEACDRTLRTTSTHPEASERVHDSWDSAEGTGAHASWPLTNQFRD